MSAYSEYPSLEDCSVSERVNYARKSVLDHLQKGVSPEMALSVIELSIGKEQYEMAEGIKLAVAQFQANPQLSIF